MFSAPFKILCKSLRSAIASQEPTTLARLGACSPRCPSAPAPACAALPLQAQQVCCKSDKSCKPIKKHKGSKCERKCEPTPQPSDECPSICPPKQREMACSNKCHKCRKPKCNEKIKKPPCYPEKPKRPPPYKGKCFHTLTYTSGGSGLAGLAGPSGGALVAVAGLHTAGGALMAYRSPIQPCKNPPPGKGSMCCMKDTDKKLDFKKCKKVCMPGCKPALHKRCMKKQIRKFERCCRILPPYPCFSECIREPLRKNPFSECNCNEPKSVCCQDQRRRRKRPPPFKCGC